MNFDHYAKTWDTDRRIARAKIIANEIKSCVDITNIRTAMEFGCGTGLVSFHLCDLFETITLVDSSEGMMDVVRSKIETYGTKNIISYHIDLSKDITLDSKFDLIYTSMVLHHISDTEGILKKLYSFLHDDGYLCIVDLNEEDGSFHQDSSDFHGHHGFHQASLEKTLENIGFQGVSSKTFYQDEKVIEGKNAPYSLFLMKGKK